MLSPTAILEEVRANDESFRLFCSVAAKNETQGGWENERIAALTRDRELAGKIARHGEDETKHGRLFATLLKKRGLDPVEVPREVDFMAILEEMGIGLSHERLRAEEPLSDEEIIRYLAHSRVTEQRAADEVQQMKAAYGDHPEVGKAIRMIADDEENHLAYCHEELIRFSEAGHRDLVERTLREYARAEIDTYRVVGVAMMTRFGSAIGWSRLRQGLMRFGIQCIWIYERLWGWRKMVALRPPQRKNAMAPLAPEVSAAPQA
jgi:rubrerythrin